MKSSRPMIKALAATASLSIAASGTGNAQELSLRDELIAEARSTLFDGCQHVEGFNIDTFKPGVLDDHELQELVEQLNFSVESFCVSKELGFLEQGVERVKEEDKTKDTK